MLFKDRAVRKTDVPEAKYLMFKNPHPDFSRTYIDAQSNFKMITIDNYSQEP